jgi:isopenicillin-N epimerase
VEPTAVDATALAREYMLDPAVAFLNHGSFGAIARPVFEERIRIQRRYELNPVDALARTSGPALDQARARLGEVLGADGEELAWADNATTGLNLIGHSLVPALTSDDEVLATDLEYGAQHIAWRWLCDRHGVAYREAGISIPGGGAEDVTEELLAQVSARTRLVLISHITSDTALRLPVEGICAELSERGIVSVIDGAHAPGQISLRLRDAPWDYYVGNLHKWFAAPRGAAFIYAGRARQGALDPLVISWGAAHAGASLAARTQWAGTGDPSASLTVPFALDFHARRLRPLAPAARALLAELRAALQDLGLRPCAVNRDPELLMASFLLPDRDVSGRLEALLAADRIEALVKHESPCGPLLRISVAWYVTRADTDRLIAAVASVLDER